MQATRNIRPVTPLTPTFVGLSLWSTGVNSAILFCTVTSTHDEMLGQVERIVQSETLRSSEALRRLLRFLGEKSASGEADDLKEYTVGVDGLGRPVTYDPRHDAAARIQVGRLRQKLAEYYRTEGKDDAVIVEVPKGQFKLLCSVRPGVEVQTPADTFWRKATLWVSVCLLAAIVWGVYSTVRFNTAARQVATAEWSPALQELWRPFVESDRPVVIMIADPLFVQFKGFGTYRELVINTWDEVKASPTVASIRKILKDPEIERSSRYTGVSEANAAFLLGRSLATHVPHISLARSSEFSWSQLANNNVVYVGAERIIEGQLQSLPVRLEFMYDFAGVRNAHPLQGEPALYADPVATLANPPSEDGESYALVTRIPGPAGLGEMQAFTSNSAPARMAAVQLATSPEGAKDMAERLRTSAGQVPRFYQIVLRVKFKGGVPVDTSYVAHRELRSAMQSR
jgi:hypothetical protein